MTPELQRLFDRERRVRATLVWIVMLILLVIALNVFSGVLESPRAATIMKAAAMSTTVDYVPPPVANPAITIMRLDSLEGFAFSVESVDGRIYGSTNGINWHAVMTKEEAESGAYSTNIVGYDLRGESAALFKSTP